MNSKRGCKQLVTTNQHWKQNLEISGGYEAGLNSLLSPKSFKSHLQTQQNSKNNSCFFKLPSNLILGKTSKTCCEMLWGFSISLKNLEIPDSPRQRKPILQEPNDISVATRPKKLPQRSPPKKQRNAMTKYFRSLPSAVEWWPRW